MIKKLILDEKLIIGIIILNAITIFLQGFELEDNLRSSLEFLDNTFSLIFVAEILLKIKFLGWVTFFKSNWYKFDFILVFLALPSLISYTIGINTIDVDFLLAFRILRVFKFFRFVKYIPKIDNIINGAIKAVKTSLFILLGFVVFNFCVSILSCFLFKELSQEHFGNPIVSFYSVFKIFTIEGWYEIPEQLNENVDSPFLSFLITLYFVILLFIGGIFGLSLVNSIFVESMISEGKDDVKEKIERMEAKLDKLIEKNTPK